MTPRRRRLLSTVLVVAFPFIFASVVTRALWGYWWSPPPLDPLLAPMTTLDSLHYIVLDYDFTFYDAPTLHNVYGWEDEPFARPYRAAHMRGHDAITPLADALRGPLGNAIRTQDWSLFASDIDWEKTGWVTSEPDATPEVVEVPGADGQPPSQVVLMENFFGRCQDGDWTRGCFGLPVGYVLRGQDAAGAPLVFVSLSSMNAVFGNDDHYHYYEALFTQEADDSLRLLDSQRFEYDSAGVEFAQWPFWFLCSLLCALPLALFLALPLLRGNPPTSGRPSSQTPAANSGLAS